MNYNVKVLHGCLQMTSGQSAKSGLLTCWTICSHPAVTSRAKLSLSFVWLVCIIVQLQTGKKQLCWRLLVALDKRLFCECLGPARSILLWQLQLALWWSLFENASASVRSGDIFSGFIYLISGSNSTVGYIQGINGCMQASLIASYTVILPAYGLVKACLGLGHPEYH